MTEQCDLCYKIVLGVPAHTYKGRCLCSTCYEIRQLVDGLMIDFKIEKVEMLILADGVDSFCRGFDAVN